MLEPRHLPTTLAGQIRRQMPAYVIGTVMLAAFQLAMNRIDWMAKSAVDLVFSDVPTAAVRPASFMLGLAAVAFVTRIASRWFIFNAGRDVEYDLRGLLLHRLHRLGTAFYRKMSAGEIMSRSTSDLLQVRLLAGFGVLNMANVVFGLASALQVMLAISLRLTLVSLVTLPTLVIATRSFAKGLYTRTKAAQEANGKLSEVLQTNLSGIRVVRSFALEQRELARFGDANQDYIDASLGLARLRGVMGPVLAGSSTLGVLLFFWYGGTLLLRGNSGEASAGITSGEFFAFQLALGRMMWPLVGLGFAVSIVQRGKASYSRLQEIFDAVPEMQDGPEPPPTDIEGEIAVQGLGFRYGERQVLADVTFEVPRGRSLAILGRTGSGKSTLALLLARLLPTPPGTVLLDGVDVCDMPLGSVRQAIGYAQQEAFLFSTTVARNIGFAVDDPDSPEALELVRHAASEAQVLEEALSLPDGLDTVVGERGIQLSGGQKQRVALARALAWKPKVLILDDPMSAVDAKTEAAILRSIERTAASRSVVLITHRVAAAARCHQIIVLDQGRVVERGTHGELLKLQGIYAAFAEEQRMANELAELDVDGSGSLSVPIALPALALPEQT